MRPAQKIVLVALALLALRAAAYPVPIVTFGSTGNALYEGEPVTIDASRSFDDAGGSLLFTYDFGDGTRKGPTSESTAVHTYKRAGAYELQVAVSDRAGGGLLSGDGRPAPVARLAVVVDPHVDGGCYDFYLTADLAAEPQRGAPVLLPAARTSTLYLQVVDWREPGRAARERLTRLFDLGGERPSVALSNHSLAVVAQPGLNVEEGAGAWVVEVAAGPVVEDVVASVAPRGVSLLGCRVQATRIVLAVDRLPRPFETALGPAGALRVEQDACSPSAAVALLPLGAGAGAAAALVTADGFGRRSRLVRLRPGEAVHEARLLAGRLLLLAASGLYASQEPAAAPADAPVALTALEGPWGGAAPASFGPERARVFGATACRSPVLEDQTSFLFAAWTPPGAPAGALTALAYAPVLPAAGSPAWSTVSFPASVAARFPAGYRVWGAVRLRDRRANLYLVADQAGLSALAVTHTPPPRPPRPRPRPRAPRGEPDGGLGAQRTTERFSVFAFPAGRAVTHLALHAAGFVALAAGPGGLWQSSSAAAFRPAGPVGAPRGPAPARLRGEARAPRGAAAAPGALAFDALGTLRLLELDLDASEPWGAVRSWPLPVESLLHTPSVAGRVALTPPSSPAPSRPPAPAPRPARAPRRPDAAAALPRGGPLLALRRCGGGGGAGAATAAFGESEAGARLVGAGGASLLLTAVEAATGVATGSVQGSLPSCRPADPAPGWLPSDVGRSVLAWGAALRVTAFVGPAQAEAVVVQAPPFALQAALAPALNGTLAPLPAGQWHLVDLRGYREEAASGTQNLTLAGAGPALTASLPAGFFAFRPADVGKVLAAGGGWGVVVEWRSGREVGVAAWQAMAAGSYRPGNWSMYRLDFGADFAPLPHAEREAVWRVEAGPCPYAALRDEAGPVRYLDIGERTNFTAFAAPAPVSNPGDFAVETRAVRGVAGGLPGRLLAVSVAERGPSALGAAAFAVGPRGPPSAARAGRRRARRRGVRPEQAAAADALRPRRGAAALGGGLPGGSAQADGVALVERLPANYRPPSKLGRGIPTNDHLYAADPSKPRYFDVYEVSRSSGRLKQCAGKASRAECGCTRAMRLSQRAAFSDCIDRVLRVFQGGEFVPKLELYTDAAGVQPLRLVYQLTELNGRDDWTVKGGADVSLSDARNYDPLGSPLLTPNSTAITFKGIELYHFRARVAGPTNCHLTTEFMVWSYGAQLQSSLGWVTISVTGVAIALLLFGVYLYHFLGSTHSLVRRFSSECRGTPAPALREMTVQAANGASVPLKAVPATEENFAPYGQLIAVGGDEAALDLSAGKPRLWLMRIDGSRGMNFNKITHHARVTQCLGSTDGRPWYMAVVPPGEHPTHENLRAFRIPGGAFIKLERGTWHAGPHLTGDAIVFYNLELEDTNDNDHTTVELGADFEILE
eukprot:tig00020703_g13141.t1